MSERPLARQSAKTLDMVEGNKGLDWDADPTDTTYAEDVVKNVRAKNYGGCSFGFEVVSDTWNQDPDDGGLPIRTLNEVKLHEISVCTFPAYGGTTVSARDQVKAAQESYNRWYERELLDLEIETNDGDGEDFDDDDDDEERDGKKPYGNVAYADPKNGKYPIDTKAHVKAAWSYINQAKNAAKYPLNGVSLSSVKAKIKAAAKKFGITISDESKSEDGFEQFEELPDEMHAKESPGVYLRLDDVQNLALDIKGARTKRDRVACIELARTLKVSRMIPDKWNREGDLVEPEATDSVFVSDMRSIENLVESLPARRETNDILEITSHYTNPRDPVDTSADTGGEKPGPEPSTLTEAKRKMALAKERFDRY